MRFYLVLCLYLISLPLTAGPYLERADVQDFMQRMAREHAFDPAQLALWLGAVKTQTSVLEAIQRPAEKSKQWYEYRQIFVTPGRIEKGVGYWRENEAALANASSVFGVPIEIIVAIIGVETFYGGNTGRHPVLDSLVTLGFDYPKRSAFFLSELEQFLLLSREQNFVPTEIRGSYAGAMGKGQFIASSYRRYALDFDDNGKIDLWSNRDAIGSVANYFKAHGWQQNEPVIEQVEVAREALGDLPLNERKPGISAAKLRSVVQSVSTPLHEDKMYLLLNLQGETEPEYWLGHHNFYVITQYNHSVMYGLAVYQLAEAIKSAVNGEL